MPEAPTAPASPETTAAPKTPETTPPPDKGATPDSKPTSPESAATGFNDAFSEIDKIISESQLKKPEPRRPAAKKTEPKPQEPPPKEPEPKPEEKSQEQPAKPEKTEDLAKMQGSELRSKYSKLREDHKAAQAKLAETETRIKELESRAGDGSELKRIQERLEASEKLAASLSEKVKYLDYRESDEYKEKFYDPFIKAYASGQEKIASLKIVERIDGEGEVVQQPRKASKEDFDAIMRIQDDAEAAELADRMFGPAAGVVLIQRDRVLELNNKRNEAIEEFKKTGLERMQRSADQNKVMREEAVATYKKSVEDGIEKYPHWFKADDGDEQGRASLEAGFKIADRAFSGNFQSHKEQAEHHAAIRNMAGAFPYLNLKLNRALERVKELETELSEFKKSTPTEPSRERGETSGALSAADEIDQLSGQ